MGSLFMIEAVLKLNVSTCKARPRTFRYFRWASFKTRSPFLSVKQSHPNGAIFLVTSNNRPHGSGPYIVPMNRMFPSSRPVDVQDAFSGRAPIRAIPKALCTSAHTFMSHYELLHPDPLSPETTPLGMPLTCGRVKSIYTSRFCGVPHSARWRKISSINSGLEV